MAPPAAVGVVVQITKERSGGNREKKEKNEEEEDGDGEGQRDDRRGDEGGDLGRLQAVPSLVERGKRWITRTRAILRPAIGFQRVSSSSSSPSLKEVGGAGGNDPLLPTYRLSVSPRQQLTPSAWLTEAENLIRDFSDIPVQLDSSDGACKGVMSSSSSSSSSSYSSSSATAAAGGAATAAAAGGGGGGAVPVSVSSVAAEMGRDILIRLWELTIPSHPNSPSQQDHASLSLDHRLRTAIRDKGQRHCVCSGVDDGSPMLQCGNCVRWHHLHCANVTTEDVLTLSSFTCLKCALVMGKEKEYPFLKVEVRDGNVWQSGDWREKRRERKVREREIKT